MEHNNKQHGAVADWCRQMFGRFVAWMEDRAGRELGGAQAVALAVIAVLTVGSVVATAGWLIFKLVQLVEWLFGGRASTDVGHVLSALPVVHVAADPIGAFTQQHAAGLPVSATTLLTVWAIGGGVLVIGGLAGARGARIAWPLYGAGTAAMAWFGAAEPHRPIAAGLTALAWGLASILVLHRHGRRSGTHITNVLPPRDREQPPGSASLTQAR